MSNVVALELSRTGIRAVEVSRAHTAKPTIQRFGTLALSDGAVLDGEVQHPAEVASALKQLWRKAKFSTKQVVLGVGNRKLLVREATLPLMPGGHTHDTLAFQVSDLISAPVDETVLDFFALRSEQIEDPETGRLTPGEEGLLIAAPKDSILTNASVLTKAGLTLSGVDLGAFALSRSLTTASEPDTIVVLNIAAHTTHVVVVTAGVPQFVRVIPHGGDDITRALMQLQDLSFAKAEELKVRLGLYAVQGNQNEIDAVNLIRENIASLLGNVQHTISYYTTKYPEHQVQRIVLAGGGSRLGGLASVLQDAAKMPVEFANPFGRFTFSSKVDQKAMQAIGPELASVLGLTVGGGE